MRFVLAVAVATLMLGVGRPAQAQTPLSELLVKVLLSDIVLAPPTGPFASHEAHFRPILSGEVVSGFDIDQFQIPLAMNATIVSQLSTIPLGSSSGGFSYTFDPSLGTFSRQSGSFGSAFAERALTAGRSRWNIGFNFQRATYDSLEGQSLRDGDIRVYLVHQDNPAPNVAGQAPTPFFEGDVIGNQLRLLLTSSVLSLYTNYGINDRLDIGVTVPVVTINMRADVTARVIRLATAANPTIHSFDGVGGSEQRLSESGRAQGLGDILLRTKYRVFDAAGGGIAAGVDFRLPTGDSTQLLGGGHLQTKLMLIGSLASGPFSPHVNVGYTISGGGEPEALSVLPQLPDEFSYTAGFDIAAADRLTVSADLMGQTFEGLGGCCRSIEISPSPMPQGTSASRHSRSSRAGRETSIC